MALEKTMLSMMQQSVAQIPLGHNITLMERIKDLPTHLWYARQTLEQGWSRDTLTVQIKNRARERADLPRPYFLPVG